MINNIIRSYLVKLGFANYYHHMIHGSDERLHWCKKKDQYTVDVLFNTRSGHIWIADTVKFGHGVKILTGRHPKNGDGFADVPTEGYDIYIEDGCYIGTDAVVISPLGGLTLGKNCVVGANSTVTQSFPAGSKIKGEKAR